MVCLDTSFVIDLINAKNEKVKSIVKEIDLSGEDIFIPSIVLMELYNGAYLSGSTEKEIEKIERFVNSFSILDFSRYEAFLAGEINTQLKKKGEMIQIEDIMIASCAIESDQVLLTRNKKDFEKIRDLKIRSY